MNDSDKMRAEFEVLCDSKNYSTEKDAFGNYWLPEIDGFWVMFQLGYAAGQKAEREEVNCKTEKLLAEFRIFIEEVERTGIYYDNAIVGTALANAWRVFDDIAARIRGKPEGER